MAYLSINEFNGNGGDTFDINFAGGYLSPTHVKAFMQQVGSSTIELLSLTFLTSARVRTSKPVPIGYKLTVYRDTPKDMPLVNYIDGAPQNAVNLDTVAMQSVFIGAEARDWAGRADSNVGSIGDVIIDYDQQIAAMDTKLNSMKGQMTSAVLTTANTAAFTITAGHTSVYRIGLTQPTTTLSLVLSNPIGPVCRVTVILRQETGTHKVVWPANVRWPNGSSPPLSWKQGAEDFIDLITYNSGGTWYGLFGGGWYA